MQSGSEFLSNIFETFYLVLFVVRVLVLKDAQLSISSLFAWLLLCLTASETLFSSWCSLHRRKPFLLKKLEDVIITLLVSLELYKEEDRRKLALGMQVYDVDGLCQVWAQLLS